MAAVKMKETLNAFKVAYKVVRENSKEIYKAFGFKHLSDATQYYVHPDNQSYSGTTTLCQPIGEAIILFATMLRECAAGKLIGDYYVSRDRRTTYLDIDVPEDYRLNGVVEPLIHKYCAVLVGNHVSICAYDQNGFWIKGNMEHLHPLYKLLPVFMVLLAREIETVPDYRIMMENFVEKPVADAFVNLHEDFYQAHKTEDYTVEYEDVLPFDTTEFTSYSSGYKVIRENKQQAKKEVELPIVPFAEDAFTDEQKAYVPHLSEEFVLPSNLRSVCNAIAAADMLAVLFHGPAGTGKTMSCKLVCQSIGLPIMETINCTENLDEFVLGKYIPQDDKIIFRESFVTRAIRDGGAVVFEEINFAKPQHLAFLNSLLDDNGFVRLDNGDVVKRHPNFRFFATMNLGYFGTKELNQALYNRFNGIALRIITRAQTIHECLHVLYTDFPPKAASEPLCDTKLKKKILAHIDNIIEDAYIEAVGCSVYDNLEFYLRFGRVSRLFASHPSEGTASRSMKEENEKAAVDLEVKHKLDLVMEFLNVVCTDLLYPMLDPEEPSEELKPYIEQAKPIYMQGSMAPSPDERYAHSKQVFEIILPLIPDIEADLEDEKLKNRLGGEKTHDAFSSSIGTEPHKGRTQQVTIRLFTDAEGNKRDDLPSLDQIMATLAQFAKDKQVALSILLVEGHTVITHGSDYDCSVMHKGIKINELHPKINLQLRKAYQNIYNKYKLNINSYNGRFAQILKAQVSYREDRYKFGSGILSTRLGDPQKRYWYRNVNGIDVPEMAILLLIDGSGSMHGRRRDSAMTSAVILHEVLKQQSILHAIVEHRAGFTEPEIDVNILVDFNAREEEKYNLMQVDAGGDNRDALALYWAERYILKQSHVDSRLIIVLSDGVPAHDYDDYYPPVSTKDTANAVRKIMKRGTDIIAISLDEDGSYECYDQLKEIYPNLIACNDLSRLTGQLLGLIAKLL